MDGIGRVRVPWWRRILAMLPLIVGAFLALLILPLFESESRSPEPGSPTTQPPPEGTPPASTDGGLPPVHWWGLAVLLLLVLVASVVVWRLRGRPDVEPEPDGTVDELLTAVDLSLEDIEQEPDPRRAVIRAYGRMETALGGHGLARRPFETPLEYLARALTSLRVGRPSVERLTALHERAKFSQHDVDASMKSEALAALVALREELAGVA